MSEQADDLERRIYALRTDLRSAVHAIAYVLCVPNSVPPSLACPRARAVPHLRALLVSSGILPTAEKQLLEFGAWLNRRLAGDIFRPAVRPARRHATQRRSVRCKSPASRPSAHRLTR
jgi:hypothetical protein